MCEGLQWWDVEVPGTPPLTTGPRHVVGYRGANVNDSNAQPAQDALPKWGIDYEGDPTFNDHEVIVSAGSGCVAAGVVSSTGPSLFGMR